MSKLKISLLVTVLLIALLSISAGAWYMFEQSKLNVAYLISQSKGPENWQDGGCSNEDCDDTYEVPAKKYKYSGSKYFDEIIEIDEYDGNTRQFAFRMSTGWNHMRNIEIGRIEVPYANKNAPVKCSFNSRGRQDWQPCTEKQFLNSFEAISKIKEEKGRQYEDLMQQMEELQKDCENNKVNFYSCMQEYYPLERKTTKADKELRNATIQLK